MNFFLKPISLKTLEQQLRAEGFELREEGSLEFTPKKDENQREATYSVHPNVIGSILWRAAWWEWSEFYKGSNDNPRKSYMHDRLPEDILIHFEPMSERKTCFYGPENLYPCEQEYQIYVRTFQKGKGK